MYQCARYLLIRKSFTMRRLESLIDKHPSCDEKDLVYETALVLLNHYIQYIMLKWMCEFIIVIFASDFSNE